MSHLGPTASSLATAFLCRHPWAPGVTRVDLPSDESRAGDAFHEVVARAINLGAPPEPFVAEAAARHGLTPEQAQTLPVAVKGWLAWWQSPPGARAEVAFAYDPATGTARELPSGGHRDYTQACDGEFVGTADVVAVVDGVVHVTDWKRGQREYVERAQFNRQVRFLALAAARAYGVDDATVQIGFVSDHGEVETDCALYDTFDLAAIAGEMAQLAELLKTDLEPHPGAVCRWCDVVVDCPHAQAVLAQVVPAAAVPAAPFRMVPTAEQIASPEHATWMLQTYRALEQAMKVARQALEGYADTHDGIATGDGSRWRRHDVPRDIVRLDEAAKAAVEAELAGAVQFKVTKESIRDAAREAGLPLKATVERVMDLLRARGCVTTTLTARYEDRYK